MQQRLLVVAGSSGATVSTLNHLALSHSYISESIDSLCRDGTDAQYVQHLNKQKPYYFTTNTLKHPAFLFEWLYDQQDQLECPNTPRKTVKCKSVLWRKRQFSYSFFVQTTLSNNDNPKMTEVLTLNLARN